MIFNAFVNAQSESIPGFTWGNTTFFNLNIGDSIYYSATNIKLLSITNQCNKLKVGNDTIVVGHNQRTIPQHINGLTIYVADNRTLKTHSKKTALHGLLTKDALLAVSNTTSLLVNSLDYVFPVTFNEGFIWNLEADNYPFSVFQIDNNAKEFAESSGISFDLQDKNGNAKHWMVAIENSRVVWIVESRYNEDNRSVDILLESESQPGIYYFYGNLFKRNVEVREKQQLQRGKLIGTVSGQKGWGPAYFTVIKSDKVPGVNDIEANVINFFPQIFELFFNRTYGVSRIMSKGDIKLGSASDNRIENNLLFVEFVGTGWQLGCWNILGKVPFVRKNESGNIRLTAILFEESKFESVNPLGYYDYEINVNNGSYRVRVKVGDVELASWQKIEFEEKQIGEFSLEKGRQQWTDEHIIDVEDGKLTIRIYVDSDGIPAGLSEIVFQQVQR